jgi:cytosine/adenosine deaminase-related metal-dependent hydrolase
MSKIKSRTATDARACYIDDCFSSLVYCATSKNIDSVIVNGEFILKHGQIMTLDEEQVIEQARRKACQIASAAGIACPDC